MSEYTFSYYTRVKRAELQRRKWWNIFGKDSIAFVYRWELKVFSDLNESEKDLVLQNMEFVQRIASNDGDTANFSLEESTSLESSYISTRGERE